MSTSISSTIGPPPLPFAVDNTLGALLVGSLFASAFWGVTSVQAYVYYLRYPRDRFTLKFTVATLWILDTFDACLTGHVVYHYLVTNYMNPESIAKPVWSMIIHTTVTVITDVLIRCMLSKRVWALSNGNFILTSIVWIISLCDLIVGLIITARAFELVSWTQLDTLASLFYASFVATFAGDLYVSIVLCYYLVKARTGFRGTDTLVTTLIVYTITTGLLPSIDSILGTVLYFVMPTNYIFMGFYFNLAKLYINSYLALLNARQHLHECSEPLSIQLSALSGDLCFAAGFMGSEMQPSSTDVSYKGSHLDLEIAVHTVVDQVEEESVARAF